MLAPKDYQPTCRICWDVGDKKPGGKLLRPCRCRGSMAHVHERCLAQWREHRAWDLKRCDVCLGRLHDENAHNMRRLIGATVLLYTSMRLMTRFGK